MGWESSTGVWEGQDCDTDRGLGGQDCDTGHGPGRSKGPWSVQESGSEYELGRSKSLEGV